MGTKTEVLRRMRLCGEPILWLHPMSIPFVRVNWESVPIGVAQGQSRVYILNGDNSFKITASSYGSNQVTKLRSEEVIRKILSKDFKPNSKRSFFMEDYIHKSQTMWDSWTLQDLYNRSCREYWFDKRRTADMIEHAKKYGLSWSRPKYFFQDNLTWFVGKNQFIKKKHNYFSPVGEAYLGQTCTIEYERFGIDNKSSSPTFAGATNITATFADGTVVESFPEMYLQPII